MGSLDMCPTGQTYTSNSGLALCPSPAVSHGDGGITFESCDKTSQMTSSSEGTRDSRESIKLQCRLGLRNGIGIIVGIIVGSGIFVSPRGVLQQCGSVGLSLIVWTTCGLTALLGGLCYAELGTSIPTSGGPYSYILAAFGKLPAFLILWVTVLIRIPAGNAIMALTFANYALYPFFPDCEPPNAAKRLLATVAVCLLSFLNCVSVKWATRVQDAFTFMKILAMAIIICAGMVQLFRGKTENLQGFFEGTTDNPGKISLAIYAGMWSFSGWDGFNYVAEEIKNPRRNLPLAIWISVPLTTGMYVLANLAMFTVLTKDEILTSNAVAVTFGEEVLKVMSWLMPFFVAFSCFGSLNGALLTGSRTFFVGARDGNLPAMMAMVNVKWFTPITSIIFAGIMTLVMLAKGDVYSLITYFEFIEAVMLAAPVLGLLYLRWKQPKLERPVKVNLVIPVLFLLVSLFVIIFPWMVSPLETLWGVIMLASGVPVFIIGVMWTRKPRKFLRGVAYVTRVVQKLFYCTFEEEDIKQVESKLQ